MLDTRRKWTFRSPHAARRIVVVKRRNESGEHVLMKALLWGLYHPFFPEATIEVSIGGRYKPDVVATDDAGSPTFWGEAGHVGKRKLETLLRKYPSTHFAFAKWNDRFTPFDNLVKVALRTARRRAPVDVMVFPTDSFERFVGDDGVIGVSTDALTWRRHDP